MYINCIQLTPILMDLSSLKEIVSLALYVCIIKQTHGLTVLREIFNIRKRGAIAKNKTLTGIVLG